MSNLELAIYISALLGFIVWSVGMYRLGKESGIDYKFKEQVRDYLKTNKRRK